MLRLNEIFSKNAVDIILGELGHVELKESDIIRGIQLLGRVVELENPIRKELEELAIKMAYDNFPILKSNTSTIRVEAELVNELPHANLNQATERDEKLIDEYKKRKVINMMIQGAAISTHGVHHVDDDFRSRHEELARCYDGLNEVNMRSLSAMNDDDIEMMPEVQLRLMKANGVFHLTHDNGMWTISAKATIMPILIHEIFKGVYELMAMNGLPDDHEVSRKVMAYTDTTRNEVMDCKYGIVVYRKVRDFIRNNFHSYTDEMPEILEYYIQELFEEDPYVMVKMVDDIIVGNAQSKHVISTIKDIYKELKHLDI